MGIYLVTIGLIFALMLAGIGVERLYRAFAARNPQLGPFRKPDGCGCCAAKQDCDTACER
ncbi:MAG: hypothetical protein AB1642_01940 [Pseudomonadota bacterium]